MSWLQRCDMAGFRFFNQDLAAPWLDPVMAFLSGNRLLWPVVAALVLSLWLWGGRRGRIFSVVMAVTLLIGDPLIVGNLKKVIQRPRPFTDHPETRLLAGRGMSYSMPSGHAAIWGAVTVVTFLYYRRRWVPMAAVGLGVGVSRMYLGVHYPTDVLAGWAVGVTYGALVPRMLDGLWRILGGRLFPIWWRRLPLLLSPEEGIRTEGTAEVGDTASHWLRLGWVLIGALLAGRWFYIWRRVIELSEDEAYQWLWSKHLDLSYYSKPPLIAYAQWLGTHIAGDRELGVRLLPPLLAAAMGGMLLRFVARQTDARTGFLFLVILNAVPLLAAGSVLMTIDPLTVFFCTVGMLAGWRAVTEDSTGWWLWVGVAWAGGFLSKYFAPFQVATMLLALAVIPGGWRQLRRPGPWLALGLLALSTVPVLVWNSQHGWITLRHLSERGGLSEPYRFTLRYVQDFLLVVPLLLNPVLVGLAVVAGWMVWRRPAPVLERYLWALGAPILLFYFAYSFRSRVQPNWVAGGIIPVALLATLYWHRRVREARVAVAPWVATGLAVGLPFVALLHDTNLVEKLVGWPLPEQYEPLKRLRGLREFALGVGKAREKLLAEGRPVFIVADHYGRAGLISFYLPEAHPGAVLAPLVYELTTDVPKSQFAFWPGYSGRRGETALFVRETPDDPAKALPPRLYKEFESVEPLGPLEVHYRGRLFHEYQLYACRNLR